MGDFNINLSSLSIKEFMDTMYSHSFYSKITEPTSAIHIDNIFTNVLDKSIKSGVLCIDVADHSPIFLITIKESEQSPAPPNIKYKRIFSESNLTKFINTVSQQQWMEIFYLDDMQKAFTLFIRELAHVYNSCFPLQPVFFKQKIKG